MRTSWQAGIRAIGNYFAEQAMFSARAYFAPLHAAPYRAVFTAVKDKRGLVGTIDAWADAITAIGNGNEKSAVSSRR